MAVSAAVAAVVVTGAAAASSANQSSIANKRAKNALAENTRLQNEQNQALQALEAEPEQAIPDVDDDSVRRHRRRSIARQLGRGGRQSTILTQGGSGGSVSGLGG